MEIFIGSDHAGYEMKKSLKDYLQDKSIKVTDLGAFSGEESVDYPDLTREVVEKVLEYAGTLGIMICGTGQGSAMAANRFKKIRAALCDSEYLAEMARAHNHANVLCLGARVINNDLAKKIVDKFMSTKPDTDERHKRRVEKIDKNVA
jgi:ribose 5-phosphate isomerase B